MIVLLLACKGPSSTGPTDTDTDTQPALDVSERLAPGEVRAGVIEDEAALFGGITAEGRLGDFKIYNDRVQFVIQADRIGSYYLELGGGVIDADIVRPEGEPGRDYVEEWNVMLGFGRVTDPTSIEVIDNGSSGEAVIRVTGVDAPLSLLAGALEAPELVRPQGLEVVTEYRLRPDSLLLEVSTTVTATSERLNTFGMGDLLLGAPELADSWTGGSGFAQALGEKPITGYIGSRNDGALALVPAPGEQLQSSATADLLTELVDLVIGFDVTRPLEIDETRTWTRYWGAGPDLAALTDAQLADAPTESVSGVVTAPDGPVAGARVHVLVDGAPFTVAVSNQDGSFEALVPADHDSVSYVTDGAGRGMFFGFPEGSASWAPFAAPSLKDEAADALANGAPGRPYAQGRGVVEGLELGQPGIVRVSVADGLPFTARVGPGEPFLDDRLAVGRPNGLAAAGWSRGETLDLLVEPGSYDVLLHRGLRYGLHEAHVDVAAGQVVEVAGTLAPAFDHTGYLLGDPHSHASPSGDGQVAMEERLIVHSAGGVQIHFGSDHDRIADYRPLVTALGLDGTLQSIVADEVSPVLRGHMNAYPLEPDPELPNFGAVSWWTDIPDTTQQLVDRVRDRNPDVIVQSNHPLDNGVAAAAGWSPGSINSPGFWVTDLDAMEVLNDGEHDTYFEVFLDLTARGYLVTPTGVSDAHGHFNGPAGINGTWIGTDQDVGALSNDDLRDAYRTGDVIVGLGVFLELSQPPGSTFTQATTLDVTAHSAPYAQVDRLLLYENGTLVQTIDGTTGSFVIDPPADTVYVVAAEGDTPMQPVTSRRPWAATNVFLFDRGGDGWSAPLPPLEE